MSSMYEIMLQLPIFQGISYTQLTEVIEKVPFAFDRYRPNEIFARAGEESEKVYFLISGEVRVQNQVFDNRVTIVQEFRAPYTLPFCNLFGKDTHMHVSMMATSEGACIMSLLKKDFLHILQQNKILLINVANILSLHAQKQYSALDYLAEQNPELRIAKWLLAYTDKPACNIEIDAKIRDFGNLFGLDQAAFWQTVSSLENEKCVEFSNAKLKLLDRYALRMFVVKKSTIN